MKNRKQQRLERRAQREAGTTGGVATKADFATPEEADAALSETAKVINIKEKQMKSEKAKKSTAGLPALPKLPKAKKDRPEHPCECGCETPTRSRFAPGHDSYIRAWAIRVERKVVAFKDVPEAQKPAVKAAMKERAAKAKADATDVADEAGTGDETGATGTDE